MRVDLGFIQAGGALGICSVPMNMMFSERAIKSERTRQGVCSTASPTSLGQVAKGHTGTAEMRLVAFQWCYNKYFMAEGKHTENFLLKLCVKRLVTERKDKS